MSIPLFYKKKLVLGFDIGHSTIKVVQFASHAKKGLSIQGYGFNTFSPKAIENGIIVQPDEVAQAAYSLLTKEVIGGLSTNRIITSIPVAKTYTRVLTLPASNEKDLDEAVRLEVEQYVPVPIDDLYIDYEITHRETSDKADELEILMVATPKTIVDSYMTVFEMLDLEVAAIETSLSASVRGVKNSFPEEVKVKSKNDSPAGANLLIDLGAKSSDLSIFDNTIRVTGTIESGGDAITKGIAQSLKITERQAHSLKSRHGLNEGKYKKNIVKASEPVLKDLIREIRKLKRYYEGRASDGGELDRLIILGGGANLPGLTDFLEKETGIKTDVCNTWNNIGFNKLQEPHQLETTMYTTAVGLALAYNEKGLQ